MERVTMKIRMMGTDEKSVYHTICEENLIQEATKVDLKATGELIASLYDATLKGVFRATTENL